MDKSRENRFKQIRLVLLVTLLLNWIIAATKIVYGLVTGFNSMFADGLHSLSDGTSNILGLIGITIAAQPADKNHPYGHRKYETLFSMGIGISLLFIAFNLCVKGIRHLHNPLTPRIDQASFMVMAFSTLINLGVAVWEYKRGRKLQSDILVSDAFHSGSDIFTSLAVIFAGVAIRLGFPILDPVVTILISAFISYGAYRIIKSSADILCDTATILDSRKIERIVLSIKGVKTCHKIRTRGSADEIYVDLHVQVDPRMHIEKAHRISSRIEEAIKNNLCGVSDVVVHVEPVR